MREEKEETEVTIEYRNVRAIHGSVKHINKATAAGHKPHLYHLTETWWETEIHPDLKEYTLIAHILGTREYILGRAKGGVAIYKHKDCHLPTRRIPFSKPIENAIATAIGGADDERGNILIIAYYLAKQSAASTVRYFNQIANEAKKFEERGYRTYLVGDGNANRNKDGTPRNACLAAEALIDAEKQADLTWICPEIEGPYFTRFDICSEVMKQRIDFDPAKATSAVDHVSAGRNSVLNNTTKAYTLTELMSGVRSW
jgi:hypothetical protein